VRLETNYPKAILGKPKESQKVFFCLSKRILSNEMSVLFHESTFDQLKIISDLYTPTPRSTLVF
jgi:hypothetical protein